MSATATMTHDVGSSPSARMQSVWMPGDKRMRSASNNNLTAAELESGTSEACMPLVSPAGPPFGLPYESAATYIHRVQATVMATACTGGAEFAVKKEMDEDGLYLHKRMVRGIDPNNPITGGGSILHHALLYLRKNGKLQGMDYGPACFDDTTSNPMESTPARPVLMNNGGETDVPEEDRGFPFLLIRCPVHSVESPIMQQAFEFCATKKYHMAKNNCIQNADFLVRVMTGGLVRSSPFIYDALCGSVPQSESPGLLLLTFVMQRTWFQVCDGGPLLLEFLQTHSVPPLLAEQEALQEPGKEAKRLSEASDPAAPAAAAAAADAIVLEAAMLETTSVPQDDDASACGAGIRDEGVCWPSSAPPAPSQTLPPAAAGASVEEVLEYEEEEMREAKEKIDTAFAAWRHSNEFAERLRLNDSFDNDKGDAGASRDAEAAPTTPQSGLGESQEEDDDNCSDFGGDEGGAEEQQDYLPASMGVLV